MDRGLRFEQSLSRNVITNSDVVLDGWEDHWDASVIYFIPQNQLNLSRLIGSKFIETGFENLTRIGYWGEENIVWDGSDVVKRFDGLLVFIGKQVSHGLLNGIPSLEVKNPPFNSGFRARTIILPDRTIYHNTSLIRTAEAYQRRNMFLLSLINEIKESYPEGKDPITDNFEKYKERVNYNS